MVSACAKKLICVYGRDEERVGITVLFANAFPRCSAPIVPIPLLLRSSLVSVCVKKWICVYGKDGERE